MAKKYNVMNKFIYTAKEYKVKKTLEFIHYAQLCKLNGVEPLPMERYFPIKHLPNYGYVYGPTRNGEIWKKTKRELLSIISY
jgi:hypothetical protein